jgi:hypothetical protein
MVAPVPCAQCGNLFMRQDLTLDKPRLCNNCEYGSMKKLGTKLVPVPDSNKMTLAIVCDRQMAIEIEEICMNEGISIDKYFERLHSRNVLDTKLTTKVFHTNPKDWPAPGSLPIANPVLEFEEKFENAPKIIEPENDQKSQKNKPKRGKT